jgi:hypothetical protein
MFKILLALAAHLADTLGKSLPSASADAGIIAELFRLTEGDPLLVSYYVKDLR